jgi:hypothetical protein
LRRPPNARRSKRLSLLVFPWSFWFVGRRFALSPSGPPAYVGDYELVSEGEFVAQDIEAGEAIFAFFVVALALAALLAAGDFAFG